jgi:DNA invertase Pin-like site-specific DNA recombinase
MQISPNFLDGKNLFVYKIFMPKRLEVQKATAVGYIRVSTEDQKNSPHAQTKAIELFCAENNIVLVEVYEEIGVSGSTNVNNRPKLHEAQRSMQDNGYEFLIVAKLDRLFRDSFYAEGFYRSLAKHGSSVLSADGIGNDSTPHDKFVRSIFSSVAELELDKIRARTRAGLASRKDRGLCYGGIPIGQKLGPDGVSLVDNTEEYKAIKRIRELRNFGYSIRKIADLLNSEGIPSRGKRWHKTTVSRVLQR